jgi:hypothetical protein
LDWAWGKEAQFRSDVPLQVSLDEKTRSPADMPRQLAIRIFNVFLNSRLLYHWMPRFTALDDLRPLFQVFGSSNATLKPGVPLKVETPSL